MTKNDIYDSKSRYETQLQLFKDYLKTGVYQTTRKNKYSIANKVNVPYVLKYMEILESLNTSYIRRLRALQSLKPVLHHCRKDLKEVTRDDITKILIEVGKVYSAKSRADFIRDLKIFWKRTLPDLDDKGRVDDTLVPYVVRHLSCKVDKSHEQSKKDRFTPDEFHALLNYFERDKRMQAFLTVALESLARPQELLYCKIQDIEHGDGWGKIHLSSHGKEGLGILQVIDSYPYLARWLAEHPLRSDKSSFIFINTSDRYRNGQLKPAMLNKLIKQACKDLKINKPITAYSLKRNGITFRRIKGESDLEIQHAARWSSTKMLKTYDKSNQQDAFKKQLARRGLIKEEQFKDLYPKQKTCVYCDTFNPFAASHCSTCKRSLHPEEVQSRIQEDKGLQAKLDNIMKVQERLDRYHEVINLLLEQPGIKDKLRELSKQVRQ